MEEVRDPALHLPPLEQGCSPWTDGQMDRWAVSHRKGHHQDPGHTEAQGGGGGEWMDVRGACRASGLGVRSGEPQGRPGRTPPGWAGEGCGEA